MEAVVRVLLGERPPPLPEGQEASEMGMAAVALAMRVQARYWCSVRLLLSRVQSQLEAAERAAAARLTAAECKGSPAAGRPPGLEPADGLHRPEVRARGLALDDELDEEGSEEGAGDNTESDDYEDKPLDEDGTADTPHQAHSGSIGAGWSSDQIGEGEENATSEPEEGLLAEASLPSALLCGAAPGAQQLQPLQTGVDAASDIETELSVEDGMPPTGSGDASDGVPARPTEAAHCDLTPLTGGQCDLPTPSAAAAAATVSSGTPSAGVPAPATAAELGAGWQHQAVPAAQVSTASAPRDHWRRLAVKAVALKRTQSRPQRLSPELGEQVLAVQPPAAPTPPPPAGDDMPQH